MSEYFVFRLVLHFPLINLQVLIMTQFYLIFQNKSECNAFFCSLIFKITTTVQYAWKILPSQMLKN